MKMDRQVDAATCSKCRSILLQEDESHLSEAGEIIGDKPLCIWAYARRELERSVTAGCPLCRVFQQRFDSSQFSKLERPNEDGDVDELRLRIGCFNIGGFEGGISGLSVRAVGSGERNFLSFTLLASADNPAAKCVLGRFPSSDVSSRKAFCAARRFLSTCDSTHTYCQKFVGQSTRLPTRVIDVSPVDNPLGPRIIQTTTTKGTCTIGRYAALSYCWGSGLGQCKTTRVTLEAYSGNSGLPLQELPQTVQDAITVTRNLSIPYLWVDALCIVQDDEGDVATELANMVQVYRNAYVTISAASAADSREGFLGGRKLMSVITGEEIIYLPCRTAVPPVDSPVGIVGLVKNSENGVVRDPIHSRAWTLQEHLLAPRLLVYGSVQLLYTCRTETLQCGEQYSLGNRMDRRSWKRTHELLLSSDSGEQANVALSTDAEATTTTATTALTAMQRARYSILQMMMPELTKYSHSDSITSSGDSLLEQLKVDMVLCRLTAELFKVPTGKLDERSEEIIKQMIKELVVKWALSARTRGVSDDVVARVKVMISAVSEKSLLPTPTLSLSDDSEKGLADEFPYTWKAIVEEFTSRRLSQHTDKLPALAAVAEALGESYAAVGKNDEYIVGHWKKYLLPQLLWQVADPATASRPPSAPVAASSVPLSSSSSTGSFSIAHAGVAASHYCHPTWSWTSIDGQIEMWPFHHERPAATNVVPAIATVLEWTAEPVHKIIPYGSVKNGARLVIKGWLQPIALNDDDAPDGKTTARLRPRPSSKQDAPIDVRLDVAGSCGGSGSNSSNNNMIRALWCLALVQWTPLEDWALGVQWTLGNENKARAIAGLVLEVTREGRGAATRVGTFSGGYSTRRQAAAPCGGGGGRASYIGVNDFSKGFGWLLAGSPTIVTLI